MIELNNLAVGELPQVMREETLMEGYWSLIEDAPAYCAELEGDRCRNDGSRRLHTWSQSTAFPSSFQTHISRKSRRCRPSPHPDTRVREVEKHRSVAAGLKGRIVPSEPVGRDGSPAQGTG